MKVYLGLICKVGTPRLVLNELRSLNVPNGEVYLLFGPIDVLIEFRNVRNIEDYIEQWFNPIRKIGGTKDLIENMLTFIVGQEGPSIREVPFAVVFVNTRPAKLEAVRRGITKVPEVLSADWVFGPYDIICPVKAQNMTDLERVVLNLQTSVSGIERTMTSIVKEVY